MSMQLQKEAMLVALSVGTWNPTCYDAVATTELLEQKNADRKAARVRKTLVRPERIREIRSCNRRMRQIHDLLTIPWDNQGGRILPVKHYETYCKQMDIEIEKRMTAVVTFFGNYADAIKEAEATLGALFDPSDYDSLEDIKGRFYAYYEFTPVPDANHFIADIGEQEAERIRRGVEKQINKRVTSAVESLYTRLAEAIDAFVEHISVDKSQDGKMPRMYDSMLQRLRDVVDVIPVLNLTNDQVLTRLCEDISQAVNGISMDQFRPLAPTYAPELKTEVTQDLTQIRERMAGFMSAPDAATVDA